MEIVFDTTDEVLLRRHGNNPKLISENRIIPIVKTFLPNGDPNICFYSVKHLNHRFLSFPLKKEFLSREIDEIRCFYTQSRLYLVPGRMLETFHTRKIPWAATREHVGSVRNNKLSHTNVNGNIVFCSYAINKIIGHAPLVVKLFLRDRLSEYHFDRECMRNETIDVVIKNILEITKAFKFEGNYPWWTHVYKDKDSYQAILEFNQDLIEFEDDFIALNRKDKWTMLHRPLEFDLIGLAKRTLGI